MCSAPRSNRDGKRCAIISHLDRSRNIDGFVRDRGYIHAVDQSSDCDAEVRVGYIEADADSAACNMSV